MQRRLLRHEQFIHGCIDDLSEPTPTVKIVKKYQCSQTAALGSDGNACTICKASAQATATPIRCISLGARYCKQALFKAGKFFRPLRRNCTMVYIGVSILRAAMDNQAQLPNANITLASQLPSFCSTTLSMALWLRVIPLSSRTLSNMD
ncbi:hypothetical protein [Rhizobium sp. CCGE531]|uniref:hypothetical protein n=1 Tax=Rhizobium sp. CCGE531 TaxID=2364271 RepID=UPI0013C44F61|nr:hypothetical protein [Rhizobium sp. CCGE531]